MIVSYAETLAITVAVELAIATVLFHRDRPKDLLLVVIFANLLTHPIASYLIGLPNLGLGFWATEALVVCAEFLIYLRTAGLNRSAALKLSVIANAVTIALSWV